MIFRKQFKYFKKSNFLKIRNNENKEISDK